MGQRSTGGKPRIQKASGQLIFALLLAFLLPLAPGCGGCGSSTTPAQTAAEKKKKEEEEKEKKDKPKPKPDFDKLKLTVMPHDGQDLTQSVKPGHWVSATLDAKANNFDFPGELEAGINTAPGVPIDLEHTAYRLFASRPVSLPKGQAKRLEVLFFVPRSTTTSVATRLYGRGGGSEVLQDRQPVSHLPSYQYFMYVLSSQPDRYRYLMVLDSIKPPWDDLADKDRDQYYRVQLPRVGQHISLPSHPLAWTSIAVLVWDDIHPKVLRKDQQQALLDWLHWGGQILVSGPRTLDLLSGSFLDPYLPATGGESITLDEAALADLNIKWTVPTLKDQIFPLAVTQPWPAVKLSKRDDATYLPGTGDLLVERRVGRGRIVVSAFRLLERDLISWRSFDSLFNNALLRRPQRKYTEGQFAMTSLDWVGISNGRFDPALISNLRFFSRDSGTVEDRQKTQDKAGLPADIALLLSQDPAYTMPAPTENSFEMESFENSRRVVQEAHQPGVAGWSDFTPVAHAARETLKEAAGIVIPHRSFVVWVIGLYLLVIVPLNWLVFWALGRVEWAWVAAPAIAVVCAMTVVKMARLDIGFLRSKTEVAILETQADYPRAHVTRYTALYTSLSTGYDVHFEDPSALAAPCSTDPAFRLLTGQVARPVMFRRDNEVHLTGYQISSNSTGMLHTEHMVDLGGGIQLLDADELTPRVTNGTKFTIESAGVLRRANDSTEYAWIGKLRPRQDAALDFRPGINRPETEKPVEAAGASAINLQSLVRLAEDTSDMLDGDVRLVGWTDAEMPGMRIEPRSSQVRHATLIVANLRRGLGPTPQKDVNTRQDINQPQPDEDETEDFVPLDANAFR